MWLLLEMAGEGACRGLRERLVGLTQVGGTGGGLGGGAG